MNADSAKHLDLIESFVVGKLDDQGQRRLADYLRTDEGTRKLYLEYIDLHTSLHWLLQGTNSIHVQSMDRCSDELTIQPSTIALRAWNNTPDAFGGRLRPRRSVFLWTRTGILALALLISFAVVRWTSPKLEPASSPASSSAVSPSVLRIGSGFARLDLPSVGYVVLEGPSEFEIVNPMLARLKQGRIRVRVTNPAGIGFIVECPDGKVTDLGTEFGLSVPAAGSGETRTSLVVFDGAVDLECATATNLADISAHIERLAGGEGVTFGTGGNLDRIMSIVTGTVATFQPGSESRVDAENLVILDVADNLRTADTKKFYEIVPGGFGEDALAYVDRPSHEWNGMTSAGLPNYLIGADYVKTFADDDLRTDIEIKVRLARPAKLYLLVDAGLPAPEWLKRGFRKTKDKVGIDLGPWPEIDWPVPPENSVGTGNSVDHTFNVWVQVVEQPGVVTLGANRVKKNPYMYGIAAVALEPSQDAGDPKPRNDKSPGTTKQ